MKDNLETLQKNYTNFLEAIKKSFSGERLEKLLHMYSEDELGMNIMVSPATSNSNYFNAYEGGYIDHVIHVARNSLRQLKVYVESGVEIDFTKEELLFSAFHHDLGKVGVKGKLNFIPNDSEWHIKTLGQVYKLNDELDYMTYLDRTYYLLQHYGLKMTEKEMLGIRLTNGLFDEENKRYLKNNNPQFELKTPMYHILHSAEIMSTFIQKNT